MQDAKEKIDEWKWDYNLFRPFFIKGFKQSQTHLFSIYTKFLTVSKQEKQLICLLFLFLFLSKSLLI
ncbi:integrase core domain-containing protein [Elizabethkingia anophelis]|uniref:hypothetical protein n=1 Tax=Elizabethkingia anophelis TaxID=1117645 RepID=UPI00374D6F4D